MRNLSSEQTLKEHVLYRKYQLCQNIQKATTTVLTMIEDDSYFDTVAPCTESEKPMGYGLD